jgi:RNA polymerase sigma-70 factor, ECF subfamily
MADASDAASAARHAARTSYGRLLAYLAWRWRDIAAAEDALAEAFAAALTHWPRTGVPDAPEAWLLTAARRNLLQLHRHAQVAGDPAVTLLIGDREEPAPEAPAIPDVRLKLLFVCAHPAIDAGMHTALMLQTVLGLDAGAIASAFLLSPSAMAQRLVRVKAKIRQAGIRFEEPEARDLPGRTHAVLEAIYAAYGVGWDGLAAEVPGLEGGGQAADLVAESIYLADLMASLLPQSAEATGLLALLLLCESRRAARRGPDDEFIELHRQDCGLWDKSLIARADQLLATAAALQQPGPFQLEAAIQAAHCHRAFGDNVPWPSIERLYAQLLQLSPTVGAQVSHAVAIGEAHSARAGLDALAAIDPAKVKSYQPFWVARAYLLARSGADAAAAADYRRALGLTTVPAVRRYLQKRLDTLCN